LFLHELIDEAPAGARVLDAGCGPGSWDYAHRPELSVVGFDVKFRRGRPRRVRTSRCSAAISLDCRSGAACSTSPSAITCSSTSPSSRPCCDELARVTRPGGLLYLSVPRAAAFDDRLYRFAGVFAKYALGKLKKRLEHQQRFSLRSLLDAFYARGMTLEAYAAVPAGFSWMNDPRTKPLQGPFTEAVAGLGPHDRHRSRP
jgi:SAM-dependent methyltransferase